MVCWNESRHFCSPWYSAVRPSFAFQKTPKNSLNHPILRYLQNGNILAARTFVKHFTSSFTSKYPSFTSPNSSSISIGTADEIILTSDPVLNFSQVAVRLCQRAQGEKNKLMRESWVRFCGTYQSKGGVLATKEIRKVRRPLFTCLIRRGDKPRAQILGEIGELFFALPRPKGQQAHPMGDIMSALMGGGGPPGLQQQRRVLTPASASVNLD